MDTAMTVFEVTKDFPSEEKFSLTDQIRRSSRSVPAQISEAWRKRRYAAAFRRAQGFCRQVCHRRRAVWPKSGGLSQ
jgi:four helix bundle protein